MGSNARLHASFSPSALRETRIWENNDVRTHHHASQTRQAVVDSFFERQTEKVTDDLLEAKDNHDMELKKCSVISSSSSTIDEI